MGEQKKTTELNIRERAEALVRRRWFIIIPLLAGVSIAVIMSIFFAPEYEASAFIQINDKRIIDPLISNLAVRTTVKDQVDMLTKQLKSWPYLMKLVDQFQLAGDSSAPDEIEEVVGAVKKRISIDIKENNIVQVAYRDVSPQRAQKIANAVAETFIAEHRRQRKEEAQNAIGFISEQLKVYKKKVEESDKNFSTHKIEADLRLAMNRRKLLVGQMTNLQKIIPSQVRMEYSPVFSRLQAHLAELEVERARLMLDATEAHPRVKDLNQEIDELKNKLDAEMKKEMVRESVSMMNPSYLQVEQELKQLDMEISYLEKRKSELFKDDDGEPKEIADEELSTLATGKKVDEDIYQMLLKQMEAAYVSERLQDSDKGGRLAIIEYARLPLHPVKPIRGSIMLMGLLVGGISGFGLAFMMERLDGSFRTVEDAKTFLQLPVMASISRIIVDENRKATFLMRLGSVANGYLQKYKVISEMRFISPHVAKKSAHSEIAPQVVIYHEPKCTVAEEYRILRTALRNLGGENPIKTLVMTSAVRGEGKSTTSANLAVALADSGQKVLLIDCDLRRGTVHQLFHVNQAPGLTHLLSNSVGIDSALVETPVKNLSVLPCGTKPMKPSELLGSPRMEQLMQKFREAFNVIVVDAPPVLNLPDASILSNYADGCIFVIQAERTQREEVTRARSTLLQSHAPLLGLVLTNVQYYIPKYLYDYYYGDYETR